MSSIYFFSGPCGVGKSTLADAWAKSLVGGGCARQVYVIHGDDFHAGFVETSERVGACFPGFLYWPDILRFNWECLLSVAGKALARGLDVVIDYVIEDELPLVRKLAQAHQAQLYYVVLTASEACIRERLTQRGNPELIDRALFLKNKLESLPFNQGHLFDNSVLDVQAELSQLDMEAYRFP